MSLFNIPFKTPIYPFNNTSYVYKKNRITYIYSKDSLYSGCMIKINQGLYNNIQSGLAHLFEHIIFELTPENKEFFDLIKQYNGNYNGATSSFITSYYFKMMNKNRSIFEYILELFFNMFINISALKYPDKVEGVINIVKNEINMLKNNNQNKMVDLTYLDDQKFVDSLIPSNNFDENTIKILKEFQKEYYKNVDILIFQNIDKNYEIPHFSNLEKIFNPKEPIKQNIIQLPNLKKNIVKYTNLLDHDKIKIVYNLPLNNNTKNIITFFLFLLDRYFREYLLINFKYEVSNEYFIELNLNFTTDNTYIITFYLQILDLIKNFNKNEYKYFIYKQLIETLYSEPLLSKNDKIDEDLEQIVLNFRNEYPYIYEIPNINPKEAWDELFNYLNIENSQIIINNPNGKYNTIYKDMKYDINSINSLQNNNSTNMLFKTPIKPLKSYNIPNIQLNKQYEINNFAIEFKFNNVHYDYLLFLSFMEKINNYFNDKYYGSIEEYSYNYNSLQIQIKDFSRDQEKNLKIILKYLYEYEYSVKEIQKHYIKQINNISGMLQYVKDSFVNIINTEYYKYTIFDVLKESEIKPSKFKNRYDINKIKYTKNTLQQIKMYLENIPKYPYKNHMIIKEDIHLPLTRIFYTFDKNSMLVKQLAQKLLYENNHIYHLMYRFIIVSYLNRLFFDIFRTRKQYSYVSFMGNNIYKDDKIIYYDINYAIIIDEFKYDIETIGSEINDFIYNTSIKYLQKITQEQIDSFLNDFKVHYIDNSPFNQLQVKDEHITELNKIQKITKHQILKYYLKYISNKNNTNMNTFIFKNMDEKYKNLNSTFLI